MSDTSQGDGWWIASDGKWYAPEQHPDYVLPIVPPTPTADAMPPGASDETTAVPATTSLGQPVDRSGFTAPGVAPTGPTFESASTAAPTYDLGVQADPVYDMPASEPDTASRRGLILAIAAVVLVAGLGFLAFRFLRSDSAAGGADSPAAAVDQLIASINERDLVGFVDIFDPDEIDAWFGSFTSSITDSLNNESQTDDASTDLRDAYVAIFDAFDYSLTGPGGEAPTYNVVPLDDQGRISRVRVSGLDLSLSVNQTDRAVIGAVGGEASALKLDVVDGARVEMRDEAGGLAMRLLVPGEAPEDEFADNGHLDLVTVQKDGNWYVSIGYSMLEIARGQPEFDRYGSPDFGRAFNLVENQTGGAATPEDVVRELFESIESLNYENIISLTDPLGTPYLHDYQPLIDSQVNQEDRRRAVQDASLNFEELELGISEWDGRTLVTMTEIQARVSEGEITIDTTNWCATLKDDFSTEEVCAEEALSELLYQLDSDQDPRDFIPDETGIVVLERNGRWYLDPFGTMGYYADQLADDLDTLSEGAFEGRNPAGELGGFYFMGSGSSFFFVEGPIARLGAPVTTTAESNAAGVALNLDGYPTISDGFDDVNVAVARVVTSADGSFISDNDTSLGGEDWFVVWDSTNSDAEIPAIAANTDGTLEVELFEPQITSIGADGYRGQLGGEGRPQVFTFDSDVRPGDDVTVIGADAYAVRSWDDNGVAYPDPFGTWISSDALFLVISGEPGATFDITIDGFVPEPDPLPDPDPEPAPGDGPTLDEFGFVQGFTGLLEPQGYYFVNEQSGGFFDGCGGPDDPDVLSYIFEQSDGVVAVLTLYPDVNRSAEAFALLDDIASPCAAYTGIEVNSVTRLAPDEVLIEWQILDDPSSITYEHYRLDGLTVVVASGTDRSALDTQIALLEQW